MFYLKTNDTMIQFNFLSYQGKDKALGSPSLKNTSSLCSNDFDISEKLPTCGNTRG